MRTELVKFAEHAAKIVRQDDRLLGLAVGGSWLTEEMDDFSDLDLIVVSKEKFSGDKDQMIKYAARFGDLLSAFTGEHVGEPRVLICLFDNPLMHVDIKFLTEDELAPRVETPVILVDTDDRIKNSFHKTSHAFPNPDYQWIEDRFWTWIHYGLLKIGRGEYFEAHDFLSWLRMVVLGPLFQISYDAQPRGVRKLDFLLNEKDKTAFVKTLAAYDRGSLLDATHETMSIYLRLADQVFPPEIRRHQKVREKVTAYFHQIKNLPG